MKKLILTLFSVGWLFAQSAGITDVTVSFSATPVFTVTAGVTNFNLTLTGNVTSSTFSSAATGVGSVNICQDGTGGRTLAWPGNFVGFPTITPTASACTRVTWKYDGSNVVATSQVSSFPSLGVGSNPITETWTVGTGGVTAQTLVQTDASAPLKIVAASTGVYGIAMTTVSAAGNVEVARMGTVNCIADTGGATAGDLVIIGTGTVNTCKDSGQTASSAIPITTRIIGVFRSTANAGAAALIELTPAHFGTQVSAGGYTGCTTNGSNGITCTGIMTAQAFASPPGTIFAATGLHVAASSVATPSSGNSTIFYDSSNSDKLSRKDSTGTVTVVEGNGSGGAPVSFTFSAQASPIVMNHNLGVSPVFWFCQDNSSPPVYFGLGAGTFTTSNQLTVAFTGASTFTGKCTVTSGGGSSGSGTPGGSNGQLQYNNFGAFGGLANPFTGGGGTTYPVPGGYCNTGTATISGGPNWTINGNTVAALAGTSQDLVIITGLDGRLRYTHTLISEGTIFSGTSITGVKASMGRGTAGAAGGTDDEMIPQTSFMQSSGDAWYAFDRPQPPILLAANTYSLVLGVRTVGANVSVLTGTIHYEVCGYAVQ